ncbi:MAG: hypothetical protein AB8A49_09395 [Prochlorococcus sp.]
MRQSGNRSALSLLDLVNPGKIYLTVGPVSGRSQTSTRQRGLRHCRTVPMNFLSLIQKRIQKRDALNESQSLMAKSYRGIDYTSAHQAPHKLTSSLRQYRGVAYTV